MPAPMEAPPSSPSLQSGGTPLFQGLVRVEDYAFRVRLGFTAKFSLPELPAGALHPLAGSQTGFAFGRRLVCDLADVRGTSLFRGDAILMWWGDDSRRGKRLELMLDGDHDAPHPLSGCAAGRRDGDVLRAVFEDAVDGAVVPISTQIMRRRLLALAHELPKDPGFRAWFLTHVDETAGPGPEDISAALKAYCGIGSRRELLMDGVRAEQARGRLRSLCAEFRAAIAMSLEEQ